MTYDLAALVAAQTRRQLVLRPIQPPMFVEKEMRAVYQEIGEIWIEVLSEIGTALLNDAIQDADVSALEELLEKAKRRYDNTRFRFRDRMEAVINRLGEWHKSRFSQQFESRLGLNLMPFMQSVESNVRIRSMKAMATLSLTNYANQVVSMVNTVVNNSLTGRIGRSVVSNSLSELASRIVKMAATYANSMAHTSTNSYSEVRQREGGLDEYLWITMQDDKVREHHADRHGVKFSWDQPPFGGHPGSEHNCRCVPAPVVNPNA